MDMTERQLVIVTGAGRSGTSTVAGALTHFGFQVPGPVMGATDANPRGHFEPLWVINFHKRHLDRAGVHTMDSRPGAAALVRKAVAGRRPLRTLTSWLEQSFEHPRLVVKDPRAFWFRDLWLRAASSLGVRPTFVTMLRHPAEVVGSRSAYYGGAERRRRARREVSLLAGWTNVTTINERTSRDEVRHFVRYDELVTDWRSALLRLAPDLRLDRSVLEDRTPHPVDDFIDPQLHRVRTDWTDLSVPSELRDLSVGVWQALIKHAVDDPRLATVHREELDHLAEQYADLYRGAVALSHDEIRRQVRVAERRIRRELAAQYGQPVLDSTRDTGTVDSSVAGLARAIGRQVRAEVTDWASRRRS